MPDYTRAQLLLAVRKDHPEFANFDDSTLFRALATDHPQLALGVTELKQQQMSHAPDDRSAGQVAYDQAGHVIKGAVGAITGIPGMISDVGHMAYDSMSGHPADVGKRALGMLGGLYDQVTAPIKPIMQTVAPGTFGEATRQDWEHGAEAAGGNLVNLEMAKYTPKVIDAATPEGLQNLAAKARMYRNEHPSVLAPLEAADISHPATALRTIPEAARGVAGAAAGVAAPVLDKLASIRARMGGPAVTPPAPPPADAHALAVQQAQEALSNKPPEAPLPPPPADAHALTVQQAQEALANRVPDHPLAYTAAAEIDPIEAIQQARIEKLKQLRPAVPPQAPDEAIQPGTPGYGAPGGMDGVTEFTPQMSPEESIAAAQQYAPGAEQAPQPAAPAEQPVAPVITPDVQQVADSLISRGRGAGGADLALTNAQYLLKVAPEIRGASAIPDASGVSPFDRILNNKLEAVGHEINAKLESGADKPVSTTDATFQLEDIADRAAQSYDGASANKIRKLADALDKSGTTTGGTITKIRQNLFDSSLDISTGPGREAYQVFKDLTEQMDPSLKDLNQKYFTLKTSAELAGLRTAGPTPESQLGAGTRPAADFRDRVAAAKDVRKAQIDAAKAADKIKADKLKADDAARAEAIRRAAQIAKPIRAGRMKGGPL